MPRCLPSCVSSRATCSASSRVGHRISACGVRVRRDDLVDQRQTERGRLAGAGARLDQQVLAVGDRREHGGLDRRGLEVAHVVERELDVGVKAEIVEARGLRFGLEALRWRVSCGGGRIRDRGDQRRSLRRAVFGVLGIRIVRHREKPFDGALRDHPVGALVGARSPDSPEPSDVAGCGRALRHRGRHTTRAGQLRRCSRAVVVEKSVTRKSWSWREP